MDVARAQVLEFRETGNSKRLSYNIGRFKHTNQVIPMMLLHLEQTFPVSIRRYNAFLAHICSFMEEAHPDQRMLPMLILSTIWIKQLVGAFLFRIPDLVARIFSKQAVDEAKADPISNELLVNLCRFYAQSVCTEPAESVQQLWQAIPPSMDELMIEQCGIPKERRRFI